MPEIAVDGEEDTSIQLLRHHTICNQEHFIQKRFNELSGGHLMFW